VSLTLGGRTEGMKEAKEERRSNVFMSQRGLKLKVQQREGEVRSKGEALDCGASWESGSENPPPFPPLQLIPPGQRDQKWRAFLKLVKISGQMPKCNPKFVKERRRVTGN